MRKLFNLNTVSSFIVHINAIATSVQVPFEYKRAGQGKNYYLNKRYKSKCVLTILKCTYDNTSAQEIILLSVIKKQTI